VFFWGLFRSSSSFHQAGYVGGRGFTGARESGRLTFRLSPRSAPTTSMSLVDLAPLGSSSSVVSPTNSRFSSPPPLRPQEIGNVVGSCSLGDYSSAIA